MAETTTFSQHPKLMMPKPWRDNSALGGGEKLWMCRQRKNERSDRDEGKESSSLTLKMKCLWSFRVVFFLLLLGYLANVKYTLNLRKWNGRKRKTRLWLILSHQITSRWVLWRDPNERINELKSSRNQLVDFEVCWFRFHSRKSPT